MLKKYIYFILLLIIPYSIITYTSLNIISSKIKENKKNEFINILKKQEKMFNSNFELLEKTLLTVSNNKYVINFLKKGNYRKQANKVIKNLQDNFFGKISHHIYVTDKNGKVVVSPSHKNGSNHLNNFLGNKSFFKKSLNNSHITDFYAFKESKHYHQLLIVPIKDSLGVIVMEVNIDYLLSLLNNDSNSQIRLISLNNKEVNFHSNEIKGLSSNLFSKVMKEDNFIIGSHDQYLDIYKKSKKYPWIIGSSIDQFSLYKELEDFKKILFTSSILGFLFIIFMFHYLYIKPLINTLKIQTNNAKLISLGEMAAGIAHEINNPLTIISSSNQIIKMMIKKNSIDQSKLEKLTHRTSETVDKMKNIINSLKNLSRDSLNEELEEISLSNILKDIKSISENKFKNNDIDLKFQDFDNDLKIKCKPVQLSQVLVNLLNNSFDEIQNHDVKWVKVNVEQKYDSIQIIVTDSGKGIPKKIRNKIFQPFFTTKKVGEGTGLGLSLSKSLIEKQGGIFRLDEKNKNTSFIIELKKGIN